jgi:O-antigen ligase
MTYNPLPITSYRIPRYAIYALLIFSPLARASVQGWAVTTIHLVSLIALASFLVENSLAWNWKWIKTPLDKPLLILIILSILSTGFSMHKYTSIWSTILLINYVTIYYLIIHTVRTRTQIRQFIYIIISVGTFLSIFGLVKLGGANPFPWWEYTDIPQTSDRLTATFGNANHLAGYMEMALPLILGLFLTGFRGGKRILMIYITIMLLAALILSLSRGGWFGAIIGLSFMAAALMANRHFENKKLLMAIVGGTLAVALIVLSTTPVVERILTLTENDPEVNMNARLVGWRGVNKMISDHPLIGTGPGTFATVYTQYQPPGLANRRFYAHSDYLQFISEVGLAVAVVIVWMIIALYRKGYKKLKNPSRLVRGSTIGAMAGITAILVHSISDFNLYIPANAILFTVLAALVAGPVPLDNVSRIRIDSTMKKPALISPQPSAVYQTE